MTTNRKPSLAPNQSRVVRLIPNEGTAQLVDTVRIQNRSYWQNGLHETKLVGMFEVTLCRGSWTRVLESECRTGTNAFDTYAEAAAYANDFIRRNNRKVAK